LKGQRPVYATHGGSNYLKAARKIDCPGSYTEVNEEAIVKIYSQDRGVIKLTVWGAHSL
jgi:hypothetical protein